MPDDYRRKQRREWWEDFATAVLLGVIFAALIFWKACK
jgi:hypothetical protein